MLKSYTAEPQAIARYGPLQTASGQTIEFARLRPKKNDFIAAFKGITDRASAEQLKGVELFIARSRMPEPESGKVYLDDLVGLAARAPNGKLLGKIVRTVNFGAGDLLELVAEGRKDTILIPFHPRFASGVDLAAGSIVLDISKDFFD